MIERILRDRQGIWQQIVEERDLNALTGTDAGQLGDRAGLSTARCSARSTVSLMALTSAVKLPLLFLVTLAICLPTLYLFNLVFGARLSVRQSVALVMVAMTVTAMLAVAFAPISLFFLITAPDYGFFKLLNVAILALSALRRAALPDRRHAGAERARPARAGGARAAAGAPAPVRRRPAVAGRRPARRRRRHGGGGRRSAAPPHRRRSRQPAAAGAGPRRSAAAVPNPPLYQLPPGYRQHQPAPGGGEPVSGRPA